MSTHKSFKKLVEKYGRSKVVRSIEHLTKNDNPAYASEKIIPVITKHYGIKKKHLFKPKNASHREVYKLFIYLIVKHLFIKRQHVAVYFKISVRTVRRYIKYIENILYNPEEQRYVETQDFVEKANEIINHIENNKYG